MKLLIAALTIVGFGLPAFANDGVQVRGELNRPEFHSVNGSVHGYSNLSLSIAGAGFMGRDKSVRFAADRQTAAMLCKQLNRSTTSRVDSVNTEEFFGMKPVISIDASGAMYMHNDVSYLEYVECDS